MIPRYSWKQQSWNPDILRYKRSPWPFITTMLAWAGILGIILLAAYVQGK